MVSSSSRSSQTSFEHRKVTFLGKRDKSSAGQIDARAVEICEEINRRSAFFTTSSCAGRAFLWQGDGVKSTDSFSRWRVTHDLIEDPPERYFDLSDLEHAASVWEASSATTETVLPTGRSSCWLGLLKWLPGRYKRLPDEGNVVTWLRFEPFILHVCCRDVAAAAALMAAARTVFKNVGLQGWGEGKLIVAIWGDEGLDMPLVDPLGRLLFAGQAAWLQGLVNDRHRRNWAKIDRFTAAVRAMEDPAEDVGDAGFPLQDRGFDADFDDDEDVQPSRPSQRRPRHFDVVGDIALLHSRPEESELSSIGQKILSDLGQVKVVAVRRGALASELRTAAEAFDVIAGRARSPLMTTHMEFGVKIVVDLESCFFSTRMAGERQRLCNLVTPGERVLVAFAGCGPEVLQLASRPEAAEIVAVELNPAAVRCARRGLDLLMRQGKTTGSDVPEQNGTGDGAVNRVRLLEGDLRVIAATLPAGHFDHILAPRPKGAADGDGGNENTAVTQDTGGLDFLNALLPLLKDAGVCHWYDFAADWELPSCERTCSFISNACSAQGLSCTVIRCAVANRRSIAERQYRIVVDFSISR